LREGIDLPEVSLVAILDADKEGFLRNKTTLIQTMGRAARHLNGRVILYADKMTFSMQSAINEINRRRKIQIAYNEKHSITPTTTYKKIGSALSNLYTKKTAAEGDLVPKKIPTEKEIENLRKNMLRCASNLDFEKATELREEIKKMENLLMMK
jgi:excinuclease ABC subunit B